MDGTGLHTALAGKSSILLMCPKKNALQRSDLRFHRQGLSFARIWAGVGTGTGWLAATGLQQPLHIVENPDSREERQFPQTTPGIAHPVRDGPSANSPATGEDLAVPLNREPATTLADAAGWSFHGWGSLSHLRVASRPGDGAPY